MKKTTTYAKNDIELNEVYKSQYLIYNRKSTDEPENQKNSIQYQRAENERFAKKENLPIASITLEGFCSNGIISEKHSAFKEDSEIVIGENGIVQYKIERPKFHKMLDLLNRGYFKGVIILCWDRISRNKADETIVRKLMKQGVDFRFVLASYDNTSSGALHMDIDGMFAAHHSRVTSEKVKLNIRNQREKGICTYKAPIGYLNQGTMLHKPIDPIRGPIIQRMFELYATGEYTLASLLKYAIAQGLTMPAMRKRRKKEEILNETEMDFYQEREKKEALPHISTISKILNNPFYIGLVRDNKGGYSKSISHEALIGDELFNKVQKVLVEKTVTIHYSKIIEHPYRGFFRCNSCQRVFTPYIQKGIQYYYSRCQTNCTSKTKSFSLDNINRLLNVAIESLILSEKEQQELDAITNTDIAVFNSKRLNKLDDQERAKNKIRTSLSYLQNAKLDLLQSGVYTPEKFAKEISSLQNQLDQLQNAEVISDEAMAETIKQVTILSELLKSLILQDIICNQQDKEKLVRFIFSELSIHENTLLFKVNPGFKLFENRIVRNSALLSWISELSNSLSEVRGMNSEIQEYIKSINKPLNTT
ncbi:MAG: recombinase family protein [Chitinophagaceae bacterium]|nr:recombinase family protein [Chitinophagaceae bacterium]